MKKLLLYISIFFLFSSGINANAVEFSRKLRVGLYYGSSALSSANLANEVGSGYSVGYYNKDTSFTDIAQIKDENISVIKDSNVYLLSDNSYSDVDNKNKKGSIYPYHLQVDRDFANIAEAQSFADNISSKGVPSFPAYVSGAYKVRIGSYSSSDSAKDSIASVKALDGNISLTVVGASKTCYTIVKTQSTTILFELDMGDSISLGIQPISSAGKAETWFKGNKYYGGFSYNKDSANKFTVINIVNIDDYTKGVVPYEMSASWPLEALKAQAVSARSYALKFLDKHKKYGFDICTSTDCQVYRGTSAANANTDKSVDDTSGVYISHGGEIASAFFHSSNGGATEDSKNVWGSELAYLKAVIDPYEDLDKAFNGRWNTYVDEATIVKILKSSGVNISGVSNMFVEEFTPVGNVLKLTVVDSSGKKHTFSMERARTILNSPSNNVSVNSMRYNVYPGKVVVTPGGSIFVNDKSVQAFGVGFSVIGGDGIKELSNLSDVNVVTGSGTTKLSTAVGGVTQTDIKTGYSIVGTGWGHNVGMSQNGAKGMAERGFNYEDILKFYFTGITMSKLK